MKLKIVPNWKAMLFRLIILGLAANGSVYLGVQINGALDAFAKGRVIAKELITKDPEIVKQVEVPVVVKSEVEKQIKNSIQESLK